MKSRYMYIRSTFPSRNTKVDGRRHGNFTFLQLELQCRGSLKHNSITDLKNTTTKRQCSKYYLYFVHETRVNARNCFHVQRSINKRQYKVKRLLL